MTDFFNYTRTIDMVNDTYWKRLPWNTDIIEDFKVHFDHCHWGQLKLFYSELEFLIECAKRGYSLNNSVIVYAGSAPGTHINFLVRLFPELYWILVDPAKFNMRENSKISILSGKPDGFYTNDTYKIILNHPFVTNNGNKRDIFFISDIRIETDEISIFKDMISQQKWLLQIKASMSMLKCRLPYTVVDSENIWEYSDKDIRKFIKYPPNKRKGKQNCNPTCNKLWYLKGDIYTQLYPPITSAETRLIIDKNRDNYLMMEYDLKAYEEKLNYYNVYTRKMTDFNNFKKTTEHIYTFNNTYENASESYLAFAYFKYYKKIDKPSLKNIVNFILNIYNFHYKLSDDTSNGITYKRSIITCPFRTILKEPKKWNNYTNFKKFKIKHYGNNLSIYEDRIIDEFKQSIRKFKEAYKFLDKRKSEFTKKLKNNDLLLEKDKYIEQIKYMDDDANSLTRYYAQLVKYYNDLSVEFNLKMLNNIINK